jgi:hypothetical protein
MSEPRSTPWKGYEEQSEQDVLRELTCRFNAPTDAARALAEAVENHEFAARGRDRAAVLDLAEWQVEALARLAGAPSVDVGVRWGKPRQPKSALEDAQSELPFEVKPPGTANSRAHSA